MRNEKSATTCLPLKVRFWGVKLVTFSVCDCLLVRFNYHSKTRWQIDIYNNNNNNITSNNNNHNNTDLKWNIKCIPDQGLYNTIIIDDVKNCQETVGYIILVVYTMIQNIWNKALSLFLI